MTTIHTVCPSIQNFLDETVRELSVNGQQVQVLRLDAADS